LSWSFFTDSSYQKTSENGILQRVTALKIKPDSLQFQPRDFALLSGLFESRVMTAEHVATLHFNGSREAAKKRLQKLKAAGLIAERKRKAYEPAVLFLTSKAFAVLRENGCLAEYPPLSSKARASFRFDDTARA
jgi:Replication-relaxation